MPTPEPIQIVAPTIVRFTFLHSVTGGRPADCIIDVSLDEFLTTRFTAVNDLIAPVCGEWQDTMVVQGSAALTYNGCNWIDLDSLGGARGFQGRIAGKPINGLQGGATAPPNVSWLLHKNCSHNRNQRAGRMYFPTIPEANIGDDGTITSTAYNNMQTSASLFRTHINSILGVGPATTAYRVVHVEERESNPTPPPSWIPTAWSSSDVSSVVVDPKVATQRRRLRK